MPFQIYLSHPRRERTKRASAIPLIDPKPPISAPLLQEFEIHVRNSTRNARSELVCYLKLLGGESVQVDDNERERPRSHVKGLDEVQRDVMTFVREEAGFAQVYTINRDGFPVGRTMVAVLDDDWSVTLVQRNVHRRLGQLRRDPHIEIAWVGSPVPNSINDRPHVFDFGLLVPRVVFVRGLVQFMDYEEVVAAFQRQTLTQRAKGLTRAPERTVENIKEELVGLRVLPSQVRAEGFGTGAQSFTWTAEEMQ